MLPLVSQASAAFKPMFEATRSDVLPDVKDYTKACRSHGLRMTWRA